MFYMAAQGLMYGNSNGCLHADFKSRRRGDSIYGLHGHDESGDSLHIGGGRGVVIEEYGYPVTLFIDASTGLICLAVLPFLFQKAITQSSTISPAPRD